MKPLSDSLTVPSAPSCPALAESAMIVIISHPALCLGMTAGQHVGTCLGGIALCDSALEVLWKLLPL